MKTCLTILALCSFASLAYALPDGGIAPAVVAATDGGIMHAVAVVAAPRAIDPATEAALFALLGMAIALVFTAIKRVTAADGFARSRVGTLLMPVLAGLVGAIVPILSSGHPTVPALIGAATAGLGTALGMLSPGAGAAALVLVLAGAGVSACACWQAKAPEYTSVKCVAARASVACTTTAAESLGPVAWGLIQSLIGQPVTIDWKVIEAVLEQAGVKDGGCVLADIGQWIASQLAQGFASSAAGSNVSRQLAEFQAFQAKWVASHGVSATAFHPASK